jgi:hypothetical protein
VFNVISLNDEELEAPELYQFLYKEDHLQRQEIEIDLQLVIVVKVNLHGGCTSP